MKGKSALKAACGLAAGIALSGCATYAVFGGISNILSDPLSAFLFCRSLTLNSPGQTVENFLFPLTPSQVKSITREEFGPGCTPSSCTSTFSGSQISAFFTDPASGSTAPAPTTGELYEYTITGTDNSTKSRWVEPISTDNQGVTLVGPGTGSLEVAANGGTAPVISGSNIQFQWQDIPASLKQANTNYGFYIVVGTFDASSSTGINTVYSAFLDEASHSTGVAFGTPSDLAGFSGELMNVLASNPQFSAFSPATASSTVLAPGNYAWTVIPVDDNASFSIDPSNPAAPVVSAETSYGIGKFPTPIDDQHFFYFKVQ